MIQPNWSDVVTEISDSHSFVRRALAGLEAGFREMALRALADWDRARLVVPEMFRAVAALQRPSWGHWNGLLAALREARRTVMRTGSPEERERLGATNVLATILEFLDREVDRDSAADFLPLVEITRANWPRRPRVGALLALPISLRNIVAHFAPTEEVWWDRASAALLPLVRWCGEEANRPPIPDAVENAFPWLLAGSDATDLRAFNGLQDDAVRYVSRGGEPKPDSEMLRPVLSAFQRLLDRDGPQEEGFKRLLARLVPEDLKGVLLGDLLVGRPVGSGGYATVHAGIQLSTGRKVAVKILRDGLDDEARARFLQEGTFLSKFNHPHVVRVLGCGEELWRPPKDPDVARSLADEDWYREFAAARAKRSFLVLEWVEGHTLEQVYQGDRPAPSRDQITDWFSQAASALVAVHGAGLIHRDVKPGNLMVTEEGAVRLMDFGIARSREEHRTIRTTPGRLIGTPAYFAPERIAGPDDEDEFGQAGDVYALSATFYELYTRRRIFDHDRETEQAVNTRKLNAPHPEPPRVLSPDLSWEIDNILLGGLQREPSDRYRSAADLERDLLHVKRQEPIEYRRPSLGRRFRLWRKRNPTVARLVASVVALVLILLAGSAGAAAIYRNLADDEASARRLAEDREKNERIARADETKAKLAAQESDRRGTDRLVRLLVGNGWRVWQDGDELASVPLFVQAMVADNDDPDAEYVHRVRLGSVLRQCPRLAHVWFPGGIVYDADFTAEGGRVFAVGSDGVAHLWDTDTGGEVGIVHERKGIAGGRFSPDGQQLLTWGREGEGRTIVGRLWDTATGTMRDPALATAIRHGVGWFSGDGRRVVLVNREVSYLPPPAVFDVKSGDAVVLPGPEGATIDEIEFAAAAPRLMIRTGETVAGSHKRVVRVWDLDTGKAVGPDLDLGGEQKFDLSGDGNRILAWSTLHGGIAAVWDVPTGRQVGPDIKHGDEIVSGDIAPDGRSVVTVSDIEQFNTSRLPRAGEAQVWDVESGQPIGRPFAHRDSVKSAKFVEGGDRLLTSGDDEVRLWDVAGGRQVCPPLKHHHGLTKAQVDKEGRWILTAGMEGSVRLWDLADGDLLRSIRTEGPIESQLSHYTIDREVDFSRKGDRLFVRGFWKMQVWDPFTGRPLSASLPPDGEGSAGLFAATADGKRSAFAGEFPRAGERIPQDGVQVWDLDAGKALTPVRRHDAGPRPIPGDQRITAVAFHPDGRSFATAAPDSTARIWSAETGEPVGQPLTHSSPVQSVAFSKDGRRILTVSTKDARVWDAAMRTPIGDPHTHPDGLRLAAISADGERLLVGAGSQYGPQGNAQGAPGVAEVRDAATGQRIGEPMRLSGSLRSLTFSPDGRRVLTACADGTARVWNAQTGAPVTPPLVHSVEVNKAFFTPDGRLVVCVCGVEFGLSWQLGEVRVWDAAKGEPVSTPLLHPTPTRSAAVDPAQRLLATGAKDFVRLWDISAESRSASDLILLAQLLSESHLGDDGHLAKLDPDQYRRIWEQYRDRQPPELRRADPRQLASWHSREASRAETARQWATAARRLQALRAMTPDDWELQARHGYALHRLGDWKGSVESLSRSIGLGATDPKVGYYRGLSLLEAGDWKAAVEDFDALIRAGGGKREHDWEVHFHRARAHFDGGDKAQAILDCSMAMRVMGGVDFGEALQEQRQAFARRGGEWRPWELRARAHHDLGHWKEAVEDYTLALEAHPDHLWSLCNRGVCLVRLGEMDSAHDDFTDAIEGGLEHWRPWAERGSVEASRGNWKEAGEDYGEALERRANSINVWHQAALALLQAGDDEAHRKLCEDLLDEASEAPPALQLLAAWICLLGPQALDDWATPLNWCQQGVDKTEVSYAGLALGLAHCRAKDFDSAIPLLEKAKASPDKAEAVDARFCLAIALHHAGRTKLAADEHRDAMQALRELRLSPRHWIVRTELELLRREADALVNPPPAAIDIPL